MAEEDRLVAERRAKRDRWSAGGALAYPYSYEGRVPTSRVREVLASVLPGGEAEGGPLRVAGRLSVVRQHGKTAFIPLQDLAGEIQLFLRVNEVGEARYQELLSLLDPGDIVGAEGRPVRTQRGEPSLKVTTITPLAKALRPPPEKWHGLADPEARLRQRYVELLSNAETRQHMLARSAIVREMRRYLDGLDFFEVETPVLGATASGGLARPFRTHYNFLDEDYALRIALELPLKRCLVGGLERVYEIAKVFRNEDLDATHSPEFTMFELYWAYADYQDVRRLTEGLLVRVVASLTPFLTPQAAQELATTFTPPYPQVDFVESLEKAMGRTGLLDLDPSQVRDLARATGARITPTTPLGTCLDKLYGHYVEPSLVRPTFVIDHPVSTTPLAKRHRSKPGRVERFELFYQGSELANAYSELNDPDDQETRFLEQARERAEAGATGEEDTYTMDEDFVEALRYGMPPAGGLGMGVDRLARALLGLPTLKDVILFPPTRRKV